MKRILYSVFLIALVLAGTSGCASAGKSAKPNATAAVAKLHWFGTSAFLYNGSKVIYFDPVTLDGNLPKADIILITHAHTDHWSITDIKKVSGPNTILIISPDMSNAYETNKAYFGMPATVLAEGQTTAVQGVNIQAVPAYGAGHPREAGGVGYIVTVDGVRIYASGGTAAYPEMAQNACDIAMIPVYTIALAESLAKVIPAKVIILEHTSYYAAKAVADLFTKNIGGKTFMALEAGPYNP